MIAKSKTPTYKSWENMKARCYKPSYIRSQEYKGRGITVCERWLHSFDNFLEDMGERPSKEYSLDRINNDGNYEPSNCRWATAKEQSANQRPRRRGHAPYFYQGKPMKVREIAEAIGAEYTIFNSQLKRCGFDVNATIAKHYTP